MSDIFNPNGVQKLTSNNGSVVLTPSSGTGIVDLAATGGGGGGTPGGTSGQVQYNNAGSFGGFTVNGDGTLNTSTGALVVTSTNGTAFAASATVNALNASNINSGILGVAEGGTGTNTVFTQNSIIFAGASGVYSQDNANFSWNDSTLRLLLAGNGGMTITSNSATSFVVGANGTTNPGFIVIDNVASAATGLSITPQAAGNGIFLSAISSNASENVIVVGKGSGGVQLRANGNNVIQAMNTQAIISPNATSTATTVRLSYVGPVDTSLTIATEAPNIYFNMGQIRQHVGGTTLALQRDFRVTGSTHSMSSATQITDCAVLAVDGIGQAGTNTTILNAHGYYAPSQAVTGTVTNAYGATFNAPTGATNNFAGQYLGGKTKFAASATGYASINLASGATPTTLVDGDLWYDGTHLQTRLAGATYQLDQQSGAGVASLNSLTGALSLTSTGGTVTITPSGSTINLESTGGTGFVWNEITTTTFTIAANNGYICNNASTVTGTLPATAAKGDYYRISGKGAGGWKVAQNSGQTIHFDGNNTTTGATGFLSSQTTFDCIEILCITANTDFEIISSIGNISGA